MQTMTGKTIGGYTLLREIGRGGMSTVYAAREEGTGRTVALKLLTLPPALSSAQQHDLVARFAREARAVAGLSHPGIVGIQDIGEQDGTHFLAMEFLDGETLRERLAHGPLTPAQALPILRQVADALDAVHAAGVVHRDVKPGNVMLLPDGTAKLLDFGVARQSDDTTITNTGAIIGSPAYMAPEQVRGEPGTGASDVWALGALLYEILAGRPPFAGPGIPSVLYQVTHENPPPVIGLTRGVQRVLRRTLEKNPQRRYPSARAVADALADALPHRRAEATGIFIPSLARPPRIRWPWATLALPVLLGLCLAGWRHQQARPAARPAAPLSAPPLPQPGTIPRTRPVARRAMVVRHLQAHTAATVQAPRSKAPRSKAPRSKAPQPRPHEAHAVTRHTSHSPAHHTVRRHPLHRTRRHLRHSRHRPHDGFNRGASEQLQKFIYSPGF